MLIEIKTRFGKSVLFSHDCEVNSMRITLEQAIKARADLSGANLSGANLSGANLSGANLSSANLSGADLSDANLSCTDLSGADLSGADLSGANLSSADLRGANLSSADLSDANLRGANLRGANLNCANLNGANLGRANLSDAKNAELGIAKTRILPEGSLIGWKKCQGGIIVKLRIPEEAKRCHAFGRKCRAEFVDVLEIIGAEEATSSHDGVTRYKVGERVTCDSWGEDYTVECSGGIHFYTTRIEAENH